MKTPKFEVGQLVYCKIHKLGVIKEIEAYTKLIDGYFISPMFTDNTFFRYEVHFDAFNWGVTVEESELSAKRGQLQFNAETYSIVIRSKYIEGEQCYSGTVLELPDVEVFEKTSLDAYVSVVNVIEDLYKRAVERCREFPKPLNS